MENITKDELMDWLGSDNLDTHSLLNLILEMVNHGYTPEQLAKDVKAYTKA